MVQPAKYPTSAQEVIEKWMEDGMTLEEAKAKWRAITRCNLPEQILNTVRGK